MPHAMQDREGVQKQYAGKDGLATRISLHEKYSVNKQGFGSWIAAHYRFPAGGRVLELGCGTAYMWKDHWDLLKDGVELVLSDFSPAFVAEAAQASGGRPQVRTEQIDIQTIPYSDATFDVVIANMMLYHVPDIPAGLAQVRRVLRPGGTFYCATFGENGLNRYLNESLSRFGMNCDITGPFTLQSGGEILRPFFSQVQRDLYPDALAITDVEDLLDYVFSMMSIGVGEGLDRGALRALFDARKDADGVLRIPKEYGMFICRR